MPFENIVGKGENASDQHFLLFPQCFLLYLGENASNQHILLFPQCFLLYQEEKLLFLEHLICRLQMLWIWSGLKFWQLVKS